MRILYILKHNPWGTSGGSHVSLSYFNAFRKIFNDASIDVLLHPECMKNIPREQYENCSFIPVGERSLTNKFLSIFTGIMHRYQSAAKKLLKTNAYDYCIFDHSSLAGTLFKYIPKSTKSIVINHNFEYKYFADNARGLKKLFIGAVTRCERSAFKNCTYNIFLTANDYEQLRKNYGATDSKCGVTGLFDPQITNEAYPTRDNPLKTNTIAITGSLDNYQNIDGIEFFMKKLYPQIPEEYKIVIAGKNPAERIYKITAGRPNISLIANPLNMSRIIADADIFLCPTRLGSGIKVRISDGLRMGLPIMAHTMSAHGYEEYVDRGFLFPFASGDEFSEQLSILSEKIQKGAINNRAIAEIYKKESSLEAGIDRLRHFLTPTNDK